MDSARLTERNLFRCEEVDVADYSKYPLASSEEFAYMETLALDTSTVHLFPFLRKDGNTAYVELYFYDVMLYPYACYKRFVICDGFRMSEEDEDEFLAYAEEEKIGYSEEFEETFRRFVREVMMVFPQWHFRDYSARGTKGALLHMYYASHCSGPREILYKANLSNLAFYLNEIPSYNIIGTTPEDILGLPLRLLRILNSSVLIKNMLDEEKIKVAEQVYRQYASFLGDCIPSGGQWNYLEELYTHGGTFAGHRFMRSLYNRLKTSFGSYSLEAYKKFLMYRDQIPKCFKLRLPDEDDVYHEVEKLKTILEYVNGNGEVDRLIKERKAAEERFDYVGDEYFVTLPSSALDFCMEAMSQSNCMLNSYIEEHAEGKTTILFLRRKEDSTIVAVEGDYRAIEEALRNEINNIEQNNPGYDEYRYNLAAIEHDPFELATLLTVLYEDYTESEVQAKLREIYGQQYTLTKTPVTEIRTRTETRWHYVTYFRDEERTGTRVVNGKTETYTYTVQVPYQVLESYEVEVQYEYHILNTTLTNGGISAAVNASGLDQEQLDRYGVILQLKGNKPEIFD